VLQIDTSAQAGGINKAWARHFTARSSALLRGLYMLGSERVAGTQAERVTEPAPGERCTSCLGRWWWTEREAPRRGWRVNYRRHEA
jgi:hypothetical protein